MINFIISSKTSSTPIYCDSIHFGERERENFRNGKNVKIVKKNKERERERERSSSRGLYKNVFVGQHRCQHGFVIEASYEQRGTVQDSERDFFC